jgi:hypothetical protein
MQRFPAGAELEALGDLVGAWTVEATHPAYPSLLVRGEAEFEWLEGQRFLIQRSRTDHSDFPDSVAITGTIDESLSMFYFDSRGVHRVYGVSMREGVWRMWRDDPDFSQRFTGTFNNDGGTVAGLWELSRDGSSWDDDLKVTYRKVQ